MRSSLRNWPDSVAQIQHYRQWAGVVSVKSAGPVLVYIVSLLKRVPRLSMILRDLAVNPNPVLAFNFSSMAVHDFDPRHALDSNFGSKLDFDSDRVLY
ncbi:hypothetical protein EVAR_96264_1 [Eumeta japonica]|uniref:Uncharacterized protein n=1 Tax=Eumeta variegata TaxID=151549 RepID=A0A4C1WL27_EUMVA|nr:hypothetical protein EVAR_96264_1 [Eumeta japonica]